jgi:hypothetical protein
MPKNKRNRDPQLQGIVRKGSRYWFRQQLNAAAQARFNRKNIFVPLSTVDLAVAIRRAESVREQIRLKIDPTAKSLAFDDVLNRHMDDLDALAENIRKDSSTGGDPEGAAASELADTLETLRGTEVAKRFYDIATGSKVAISALLDGYARERDASESNLRDKRWAISRAGIQYLEDVPTKRDAAAITSALMKDTALSKSSVAAIARNLSGPPRI